MPVVILNAGAVDPWINLDGRLNAPTGTPQLPTLLNSYVPSGIGTGRYYWPYTNALNGSTGNLQQPPWHVAGVDYAVGLPAGAALVDWQTIGVGGGNQITGVTVNTGTGLVSVTGNNVTVSNVDFSLHGGASLFIGNVTNTTIQNCNFGYTGSNPTSFGPIQTQGTGVVIQYCTIDGNGVASAASGYGGGPGCIVQNGGGNLTVKYCWIKNCPEDVFETGSTLGVSSGTSFTFKYNLIQDNGQHAGAHPDWTQLQGTTNNTFTIQFTTVYLTSASGGSDGWWLGTPGSGGPSAASGITTTDIGYNTLLSVSSAANVNDFFAIATANNVTGGSSNQVTGPVTVHDNFIDPTFGVFARAGSYVAGVSLFNNNTSMVDATSFTNTP